MDPCAHVGLIGEFLQFERIEQICLNVNDQQIWTSLGSPLVFICTVSSVCSRNQPCRYGGFDIPGGEIRGGNFAFNRYVR